MEDNAKYLFHIGPALTKVRKQAGLTQDELAFRSKLNRSHLSKLEQNGSRPTLDTIIKLGIGLDMPLNEFVNAVNDEKGFREIFDTLPVK